MKTDEVHPSQIRVIQLALKPNKPKHHHQKQGGQRILFSMWILLGNTPLSSLGNRWERKGGRRNWRLCCQGHGPQGCFCQNIPSSQLPPPPYRQMYAAVVHGCSYRLICKVCGSKKTTNGYEITNGSCSFIEYNGSRGGVSFATLTDNAAERKTDKQTPKNPGELDTAMSSAVQAREASKVSSHRRSLSLQPQLPHPHPWLISET